MNSYLDQPFDNKTLLYQTIVKKKTEDPPFFNSCFDKSQIKNLVSWFLKTYGEKQTIDLLESLKYLGFHQATLAGISLGIEDLEISPDKPILISKAHVATHQIDQQNAAGSLTSVEKSQCLIDTWNQTSDLLRVSAIQNFRTRNSVNPVYMMAFSGARGNVSQVRQLVAMRGLMADPQGAILEFPIQSNFREGLTITEYLISCYGARKGLVDTALRTATSGYLTRRLVDSAQHAVVSMIDCGTQRGIVLQGHALKKRIFGRVLAKSLTSTHHITFQRNSVISADIAKIIGLFHTKVLIRSPLTCAATTSICQLCYGWNLASGKLVHMGEAVGVIAAQSIGEPGTQLTMRTFHTGGVGVLSDQALKQIETPYQGKIIFKEALPGRFIRTPHGKIAYMVKYSHQDPNRLLFKIKSIENSQRDFVVREQEFPSGSLLFVKNGEVVVAHQLVAQALHVQLKKQKLPESSHPVYSPLDGQVFFESMPLSVRKEVLTPTEKQKKNNEKSPIELPEVRTMSKIGSFWVFSGHNQHEIHTSQCFLEPGDLISPQSILFDYHFYTSGQAQLKRIGSKFGFGVPIFQIPINNVHFIKCAYKISIKRAFSEKFLYQSNGQHDPFFIWYPSANLDALTNLEQKSNLKKSRSDLENEKLSGSALVYTHLSSLYLQLPFSSPGDGVSEQLSDLDQKIIDSRVTKGHFFILQMSKKLTFQPKTHNQSFLLKFRKFVFTIELKSASPFMRRALNTVHLGSISRLSDKHFTKKQSWFYIPKSKTLLEFQLLEKRNKIFSNIGRQLLPTGVCIDDLCFPKQYILFDIISQKTIELQKAKRLGTYKIERTWYTEKTILDKVFFTTSDQIFVKKHIDFQNKKYQLNSSISNALGLIWYKFEKVQSNRDKNLQISCFFSPKRSIHKDDLMSQGFEFHFAREYSVFEPTPLRKKWANYLGKINFFDRTNPLSSKQIKTIFPLHSKAKIKFQLDVPIQSGWILNKNLTRIHCILHKNQSFPNLNTKFARISNSVARGLNVFLYQFGALKNSKKLSLQTYSNNWIIPSEPFSTGCIKARMLGEFRYKSKKTTGTFTNTLRLQDLLTLKLRQRVEKISLQELGTTSLYVGKMIRWGDEIYPGIASAHNGQILKLTSTNLTLQVGIPLLASARGIVHVFNNELITKNQILMTLKSRRLQTEDIVQGIPKIEQLFEARESQGGQVLPDSVHSRLRNAFVRELEHPTYLFSGTEYKSSEQRAIAVETSFLEAQHFLVENIVDAYANQGVKISEKHVEVIVRQMTSRVRILEGGETGLLPGEFVQHRWIQQFNKHLRDIGLSEATYEPLVLGISKSVLQSESFLLAASFQEVSRVLVRSALSKKRDFLRGLHENVIVGQLIPAGTGLVPPSSITPTKFSLLSSFLP